MTTMKIRDVLLFVKVIGKGYPLVLMHGGPGADLYTLMSFRPLADRFTLVFYDHRCNGRSTGAPVESMNFENLTADADVLRQALGFEKWAVLGHSFGGIVALEYALRYPQNLSHLLLVNSGADFRWPRERSSEELTKRGFSPEIVNVAPRHFSGQFEPNEMFSNLMKLSKAYNPHTGLRVVADSTASMASAQDMEQPRAQEPSPADAAMKTELVTEQAPVSSPSRNQAATSRLEHILQSIHTRRRDRPSPEATAAPSQL